MNTKKNTHYILDQFIKIQIEKEMSYIIIKKKEKKFNIPDFFPK